MEIKVRYSSDIETIKPQDNSDWIDLATSEDVIVQNHSYVEIPLGVAMQLPDGYEAYVIPRSSTFKRYGLIQTNSMGLIDNSYCGDNDIWKFPAWNTRDEPVFVPKGTRICQFRIQRKLEDVKFLPVENLGNADRGGLGSTGTN